MILEKIWVRKKYVQTALEIPLSKQKYRDGTSHNSVQHNLLFTNWFQIYDHDWVLKLSLSTKGLMLYQSIWGFTLCM